MGVGEWGYRWVVWNLWDYIEGLGRREQRVAGALPLSPASPGYLELF